MEQVKWFERDFQYNINQNIFPAIMERLAGTPIRLEEKLKAIPENILSKKVNNTWTIKENVGHLTDLEPLWQGRLEDIKQGATELRPTDLQNTKTTLANHDAKPLVDLLNDFRKIREQTLKLLENLDEGTIFKAALHPRLKTPMRTLDLFLFVADHDDHHLARITELLKTLPSTYPNSSS
ncbi:DinB family protein [Adhaeribacter radiodurans]|uniref:DinB family protein n=1 Tax=Adhaeribacter radiodurans TaxID=2745197 RepID=A0A7L7L6X5_9BACT|nr:DinB family protein [Adhaeribacter radiodurans]QMU28586.1 DinB family protein [Adhaeribacter radiodurans]